MQIRELTVDEFSRIPPEATANYTPVPGVHRVSAAFDGDEIVGIWVVLMVPHAEPIWIREDHRGGTLIPRLWDGVKAILEDMGLNGVVGIIPDSNPATKRIAKSIGAVAIPGSIFLWLKEK